MSEPPAGQRDCAPESRRLGLFEGPLEISNILTGHIRASKVSSRFRWSVSPSTSHTTAGSWIPLWRSSGAKTPTWLTSCSPSAMTRGTASETFRIQRNSPCRMQARHCPMDARIPNTALPAAAINTLWERILNVIRDVDTQFGRLVDGLAKDGALDRAAVVCSAITAR